MAMTLKEQALAALELAVSKLVEDKAEIIVSAALAKLKQVIPGKLDDVLMDQYAPEIKAFIKAELLAAAGKIDGK